MSLAIESTGLEHRYDGVPVLNGVDLRIREGEWFIVIGPNGSGKTTLLRILAGILAPTGGDLHIRGRALQRYGRKELARILAYVPQQVPADSPFSVLEVVLMGRAPHQGLLGLPAAADRDMAMEAIDFTGVSHLTNRRMDALSGGERHRVFLARAICQQPRLMLLDEPTASLDLAHQVRIMDLLEKLRNDKGTTVIMVSHDVNLAAMYADRLLLLKSGTVMSTGSPEAVLTYQTIESAYGCTLLVDRNPLGGVPRITPVPGRHLDKMLK